MHYKKKKTHFAKVQAFMAGVDGRKSHVKTVSSEGRDLLDMAERQRSKVFR